MRASRTFFLTAQTALALFVPISAHAEPVADPTDGVQPLERAHAHNDYEHPRPLFDALSHGFRSVEADVWLVDGELCIGHDAPDCSRTLESLYLEPLAEIAGANGGEIYDGATEPLRLYVDVKDGGQAVWDVLADQLDDRPQLVSSWANDRETTRAVEVVVSGQLANQTFDDPVRWASGDGRIATPPPADATSADLVVLSERTGPGCSPGKASAPCRSTSGRSCTSSSIAPMPRVTRCASGPPRTSNPVPGKRSGANWSTPTSTRSTPITSPRSRSS